ncbi:hypothetical protein [Brachyspira hyodysenteriae]|uniref:hypothetical protein n=1 Tax=Brachyspira hyodysenteriae TaxID=159 RepID=UPI00063D8DE5|nr:hypothetical protein [Brachyspira hyodysenteriae]KLI59531.1 hypothetical protein SZ44_08165 [Brachyspira hyodysenteriae]
MDILIIFLLVCFSPLIIYILVKVSDNMNKEYMRKEALKTSKLLYDDSMSNFNRMSIILNEYKKLVDASNEWINNKDTEELKEALKEYEEYKNNNEVKE